ncbi:laccase-8-like [Hibiscus syriacus]|uniref:Laccase-8-like n=2 Tax=Hibiscus syriacus TaxID=106335 RepID=A0A6A3CIE4_HIBSY|nr:laccase-8-like [Hibiscus syriacus]KAE8727292.1 laccase-8-like [Hibiscus syriacus]
MSSLEISHFDLEQGTHRRNGSDMSADEASVCFSDADEGSCYSQFYSTTGGSYDDCGSDGEIGDVSGSGRVSSASDCSVVVQIQNGANEIKVHLAKVEKDCRICHLGLESNSHESGGAIELGCSCKDDLAAAHKHCAEAWFKIRGNKTCEICQSIARNVVGVNEIESAEQPNDNNSSAATAAVSGPVSYSESRNLWHGHRFLNLLLACMVFALVISWLFHLNVPSS